MRIALNRQQISLLATLFVGVLLFFVASLRYDGFASVGVIVNLFDDNAFLGIAAIGMTFVILSGGIDLSVGAVIGLTSLLAAILIERVQISPYVAIPIALSVGALFGATMGTLIAVFELAPFLVTLAGMFFARGLALTLSLDSIPLTHPLFARVSQFRLPVGSAQLPPMALVFLVVIVIAWILANWSHFGRATYALGGNQASARLMGLAVRRTQILIYTLSGFLAALAGLTYTFYTSSGNATAAMGLELDAIAAAVIGGTLLTGGSGSVWGTLAGTMILGMIQTMISFEGTLSSWWTRIAIGVLLFVFVVLQRLASAIAMRAHARLPQGPLQGKSPPTFRPSTNQAVVALLTGCTAAACASPADARTVDLLSLPHPKSKCQPGQFQGRKIDEGLHQLTGTFLRRGMRQMPIKEIPDPAPPFVTTKGEVEIYGSSRTLIRYKNWNEFLNGGCFDVIDLDFRGPNEVRYLGEYTQPWDLRKFRVTREGMRVNEAIIAGSMSPTNGRRFPTWPEDNITRRIYFYRPDAFNQWVRDLLPIIGRAETNWVGHSYGGNLIQVNATDPNEIREDSSDPIAFFYEKVTQSVDGKPTRTEIFAARMKDWQTIDAATDTLVLSVGAPEWPATKRTIGGHLVEGPRPIEIVIRGQRFFMIGFSSGDFPTDSYTLNYAWSRNLMGPYEPILTADGNDLLDLGKELKATYGLSWVGRPSFFRRPDGGYEMLFHGVIKDVLPDNDYTKWPDSYELWEFFRCLFKARAEFDLDPNGAPVVTIMNGNRAG